MQTAAERQYLRTTAMIKAAEGWAKQYSRDPKSHAKLIKLESRWQLELNRMFKKIANNITAYVNLGSYASQLQPHLRADDQQQYNIDIIINDNQLEQTDNTFISLSLEIVTDMTALGALGGQTIYGIPLGINSASANIQHLGLVHVASLVGKKILDDGSIVDNPDAQFNITNTIRNDIAASIKQSLARGDNVQQAVERLQRVIADPIRAERIVRTESVNAYQQGLKEFADDSGAIGKEWQDAGAIDICEENTAAGPIPIDDTFPSGDSEPTAHIGCRCGMRYIYQAEWNNLQN